MKGALGASSESINGVYIPTRDVARGKLVYSKLGLDAGWLVCGNRNNWMVTDNIDTKNGIKGAGYATTEDGLASPVAAKKWDVATKGGWIEQQGMSATFLVSLRCMRKVQAIGFKICYSKKTM